MVKKRIDIGRIMVFLLVMAFFVCPLAVRFWETGLIGYRLVAAVVMFSMIYVIWRE